MFILLIYSFKIDICYTRFWISIPILMGREISKSSKGPFRFQDFDTFAFPTTKSMAIITRCLLVILLAGLLADCNSKKKSMAGEEEVEIGDFIDFFPLVKPPYQF